MSKLEEEHSQALDCSANKVALVRKELETLQVETDKLRSVMFPMIRSTVWLFIQSLEGVNVIYYLCCYLVYIFQYLSAGVHVTGRALCDFFCSCFIV